MQERMIESFRSADPSALDALHREVFMRRGKSLSNNDQQFITCDTALRKSRPVFMVCKFNKKSGSYQIIAEMRPRSKIKSWIDKVIKWIN